MFEVIKRIIKPHPTPYSEYKLLPLEASEQLALSDLGDHALQLLRQSTGQDLGFDVNGLQISDSIINLLRADLTDEDEKTKVANLQGAYYARVLFKYFAEFDPAWVKTEDGVGVVMRGPQGPIIALPITRVFRQIDEGECYSILAHFVDIAKALTPQ